MFFYWEIKHPDLDDSAFNAANTINCAGNSVANNFSGNISSFTLPLSNNSCAKVKVTKSGLTTIVESRGYNTACDSTSSFKVERAIQLVSVKKQGEEHICHQEHRQTLLLLLTPTLPIQLNFLGPA